MMMAKYLIMILIWLELLVLPVYYVKLCLWWVSADDCLFMHVYVFPHVLLVVAMPVASSWLWYTNRYNSYSSLQLLMVSSRPKVVQSSIQ